MVSDPLDFLAFVALNLRSHLKKRSSNGLFCQLHKEFASLVQYDRVAACAPRGHGKSSFFSLFYPLYLLCTKKDVRLALVNSTFALASVWSARIRYELETNKSIMMRYGELATDKRLKMTDSYFQLANGNVCFARGYGQAIRGERPTYVIADDLEDDEMVVSEDQRNKFDKWFSSDLTGTLLPEAQMIWIGTILHPQSALAEAINKGRHGWVTRFYQAIKDGKSVWPEMWPLEELEKRRLEIGTESFNQEYMNDPIPDSERRFKKENFKYYNQEPKNLVYYMAVDPAIKLLDKNDYSAIVVVGVDFNDNWYIIAYRRQRMQPKEIVDLMFEYYQRYNCQKIGIEDVGFQEMLIQEFKEQRSLRNLYPQIEAIKTGGVRKTLRIQSLQPRFECGKIFFKEGMTDLENELLLFPSPRYHDDLIDATSMLLKITRPASAPRVEKNEETFEAVYERRKSRIIQEEDLDDYY